MGKRQEARGRIEAQIIEIGRRHLVTDGAAGLSLRAIARDMGMVSSAVYRYVASRDELLTLLLVDAYTEVGEAASDEPGEHRGEVTATDAAGLSTTRSVAYRVRDSRADAAVGPPDSWDRRFLALAHAVRGWALAQPARWALLYGSPVPGYHAPAELTVGPGTRVVAAMFAVVAEGIGDGSIPDPTDVAVEPLAGDFDGIRAEFGFTGGDPVMLRCLLVWAALVGAVSLEVFGQYGPDTLTDARLVFDGQARLLARLLTQN